MAHRPLTAAEAWQSYQVHSELSGGHTVAETLAFVSELQDVEDEWVPPANVISPDLEPRCFLRRIFRR